MKQSDKKALGRSVLNTALSFGKGILGGINPVIGAAIGAAEGVAKGVQKEKDKNLSSQVGGEGSIDIAHLVGVGVFILLVILFAFGKITMENVQDLLKMFLKTQ